MTETISKAQANTIFDAMLPLMKLGATDPLEDFTVPVGPASRATVQIAGQVTPEVFDALIAQLQVMKKFAAQREVAPPFTARVARELFNDALARLTPSKDSLNE